MGSSKSSSATTASMIGPWVGSFSPAETAGLDVVESVKKEYLSYENEVSIKKCTNMG